MMPRRRRKAEEQRPMDDKKEQEIEKEIQAADESAPKESVETPIPEPQPELGDVIRAKRVQMGLTLRDLELMTDIDHSVLSRIENKKVRTADYVTIRKLAHALRIDANYLLSLQGMGIADPRLRIIARGFSNMTEAQRDQLLRLVNDLYQDPFQNASHDLDWIDQVEYPDGRVKP